MRDHNVKCQTIQVHLKDPSMKTISRQVSLQQPTRLKAEMVEQVMRLVGANWHAGEPVRALTITAAHLIPEDQDVAQMSLFEDDGAKRRERLEKLEDAVYKIRTRFGPDSIQSGAPDAVTRPGARDHSDRKDGQ
jgi:DNA polymerase-4